MRFTGAVLENGALPVIVVFPDPNDQLRSREGKGRSYEPLLQDFRSKGYRFIDMLDALKQIESRHTFDELTVNRGHFSALGNEVIARSIPPAFARLAYWIVRV